MTYRSSNVLTTTIIHESFSDMEFFTLSSQKDALNQLDTRREKAAGPGLSHQMHTTSATKEPECNQEYASKP